MKETIIDTPDINDSTRKAQFQRVFDRMVNHSIMSDIIGPWISNQAKAEWRIVDFWGHLKARTGRNISIVPDINTKETSLAIGYKTDIVALLIERLAKGWNSIQTPLENRILEFSNSHVAFTLRANTNKALKSGNYEISNLQIGASEARLHVPANFVCMNGHITKVYAWDNIGSPEHQRQLMDSFLGD